MGFDLDDFAALKALGRAGANARLELLDLGLVDPHGASAYGDVVVLREDPGVEVGGDIVAHVHFGQVFVVGHFVVGQANALLEGDRIVVIPGLDGLGNP